jgi:hypothetical protein
MSDPWEVDERPPHQPEAYDAPIPGRHWYAGCDPDLPRVNAAGVCEGCGARACPECGRENCPDHPTTATEVILRDEAAGRYPLGG